MLGTAARATGGVEGEGAGRGARTSWKVNVTGITPNVVWDLPLRPVTVAGPAPGARPSLSTRLPSPSTISHPSSEGLVSSDTSML